MREVFMDQDDKLVTAFLPCRKGSERVKNKNIRPFAGYEKGLLQIKLSQLTQSQSIHRIVLSTNDESILKYAKSLSNKKIELHKRDETLSSSKTSTDELVSLAEKLVGSGHVLWTHVTSPFVTSERYDNIIDTYFDKLRVGHDSLMTTTEIKGFLWKSGKPLNYDRKIEKWPRTQTLEPISEVNSAVFLNSVANYASYKDRIGNSPFLYNLEKIEGFDIDWPEDFEVAEVLAKHRDISC